MGILEKNIPGGGMSKRKGCSLGKRRPVLPEQSQKRRGWWEWGQKGCDREILWLPADDFRFFTFSLRDLKGFGEQGLERGGTHCDFELQWLEYSWGGKFRGWPLSLLGPHSWFCWVIWCWSLMVTVSAGWRLKYPRIIDRGWKQTKWVLPLYTNKSNIWYKEKKNHHTRITLKFWN